ncbi:MAG: ABC transporter ATP-binding protein [Wujia sp.]
MLEALQVVKTFEKNEKHGKKISFNAVDGVSLTVADGEIVGILGPNGAGKTTLLRMLGHLMKPTSGTVTIRENGVAVEKEIDIKSRIGYLSGNTKLYGRLSTREMLTIMGNIYGLAESELKDRIEEICEVLDMESFIDNRIEKLSTGQTQRASIARCLVHNPEIYIFDEPTLGLDIISSSAIVNFMKTEKKRGKSVIYSTHYMEEAEQLCDRIIMMNKGRIMKQGAVDSLKTETESSNLRDVFLTLVEQGGQEDE